MRGRNSTCAGRLPAWIMALLLALTGPILPGPALSRPAPSYRASQPTVLGAASNFGQGWNPALYRAALALGVRDFRDGLRWIAIERSPGHYRFDRPTTLYPDILRRDGAALTLTLNWGNPLYDGGQTPHSAPALRAFGQFAGALAKRFPAITAIEIGNEVNGGNFVNGPVREGGLAGRISGHLAMVAAAAASVRASTPQVGILGGSTHSLPGGFLWPLVDAARPGLLSGLAVHPYTTPIDQLAAQFGVLRRNPKLDALAVHVTEFGSADPAHAADDLIRGYAALASLGAAQVDWYPLNPRGDGMVPLLEADGQPTAAGLAFRFARRTLADFPARDISPDAFTFVHAFGPRTYVMWGAARPVAIAPDVRAYDATGRARSARGLALAPDRALIVVGGGALADSGRVTLGCNPLVADSAYGFSYPPDKATGGFETMLRAGSHEVSLQTMPGQQTRAVPWTPYLGRGELPGLRLQSDRLVPRLANPADAVIFRYRASHAEALELQARLGGIAPGAASVSLAIMKNGAIVRRASAGGAAPVGKTVVDLTLPAAPGDRIDFAISMADNRRAGPIPYRFRVLAPARCPLPETFAH